MIAFYNVSDGNEYDADQKQEIKANTGITPALADDTDDKCNEGKYFDRKSKNL